MGVIIPQLENVLIELRDYVENINKAPQMIFKNGIYQQRNKDDIQKTKWMGWEFGYQIEEIGDFFIRKCFIKSPENWDMIDEKVKNDIAITVLEATMTDQQSKPVFVRTANDVMCIGQKFQISYLVEKNPRLRSISNMSKGKQ